MRGGDRKWEVGRMDVRYQNHQEADIIPNLLSTRPSPARCKSVMLERGMSKEKDTYVCL